MMPNYNEDPHQREIQRLKGQIRSDSIIFHCFFGFPFMLLWWLGDWDSWFWYIAIFFPYAVIGQIGLCAASWNSTIKTVSTYSSVLYSTRLICFILLIGVGLGFIASLISVLAVDCSWEDDGCEDDQDIAQTFMIVTLVLCFVAGGTLALAHYSHKHAKHLLDKMKDSQQVMNSAQPLNAPLIMNQQQFVYPPANVVIPQNQPNYYQNAPQPGYNNVPPGGYPYVQPAPVVPLPPPTYQQF